MASNAEEVMRVPGTLTARLGPSPADKTLHINPSQAGGTYPVAWHASMGKLIGHISPDADTIVLDASAWSVTVDDGQIVFQRKEETPDGD